MSESIGKKLKAARESRRLTLDKAAESTRIRALYLQALENDDYSVMVSAAQGRGFLRNYAEFLGLNLDELTASARDSKPSASPVPEAASTPPTESTPEAAPAPEQKSARPGFWARLLRREPAAAPVVEEESESAREPAPAPIVAEGTDDLVAPVDEEEPLNPAKKSTRKKSATSEEKSEPEARKAAAGKKKQTSQ